MSPPSNYHVQKIFDTYAKSQLTFVQNFAGQANELAYAECLRENHAVEIVQPLLDNIDPEVRMTAVLGLSRLAGNSRACAKQILCANNLLKGLLGQIASENKSYKKNSMKLIRNLSKHLSSCSEMILSGCDGIHAILTCMKDSDVLVREVALQAISSIAGQDPSISVLIISSGILPQIVQSLKEERHNFKLHALSTLSEIAKHNQKLAKKIVDMNTLPKAIIFLSTNYTTEIKLQASALALIKNIAKHSLTLTETVIESNIFPEVLLLMAHPDESIRYNSADVVYEVVKHSVEVLKHLTAVLKSDTDNDCLKAGTAWTLEMIGQHGAKHSKSVFDCNAVSAMIDVYIDTSPTREAHHKCKSAIQIILSKCEDFAALEQLLTPSTPIKIMPHILLKMSKMLTKSFKARRIFIKRGHLKMIQNLKPEINSHLYHVIKSVNCCFPETILQMVSGDIPESILKKLDKYVPKSQCFLYDTDIKTCNIFTNPV
ncbi:sperm-associated antigen 6-like isoform X2 [Acyrthosiphon pisum]|uniref:Sperm-associated antigen 6-like n=1 Tax=Acyrthosiphon pisum TaxID=7029 RepID=A0A8R2B7L7_ACYPI|nr:sperm-associated antigen 6-like isoform X2 [Acyrthosiphon pisum]|eukprot:XP_008185594.1 PREDICTED: sperm-associated antigen 6-like isoform X2 [Acyrthosiphon pisum]